VCQHRRKARLVCPYVAIKFALMLLLALLKGSVWLFTCGQLVKVYTRYQLGTHLWGPIDFTCCI